MNKLNLTIKSIVIVVCILVAPGFSKAEMYSFKDHIYKTGGIYGLNVPEVRALLATQREELSHLPIVNYLRDNGCANGVIEAAAKDYGVPFEELYEMEVCAEIVVWFLAKAKERCDTYPVSDIKKTECAARLFHSGLNINLESNKGKDYARRYLYSYALELEKN